MCSAGAAAGGFQAFGQGVTQTYVMAKAAEKQRREYNFLADRTEIDKKLAIQAAEQNVNIIQEAGAQQSKELQRQITTTEGAQKAAFGAMGTGGSVTAADIMSDSLSRAELDKTAIRYNTDLETWNIQDELKYNLWDLENKRIQYNTAAKNAMQTAKLNAAAAALGGTPGSASSASNIIESAQYNKRGQSQLKAYNKQSFYQGKQGYNINYSYPGVGSGSSGKVVSTGNQSIGGRSFSTAWSPTLS